MGGVISIWLDSKQLSWLDKQGNRSKCVQQLINEGMHNDMDTKNLLGLVKNEENLIVQANERLNDYYNKLQIISEQESKIINSEKERIANMLADKKRQTDEKFRKIEASPYFKLIEKLTEYDDKKVLAIIEKCRRAGNRDFGTYDIKEYLEAKHGTDKS
jgi:hypothetical protein